MSGIQRTLLLSSALPPFTSGSAVIVGNLAKQFSRGEMVLAGEQPHEMPEIIWQKEWPEICYLTKMWPITRRGRLWRRRLLLPLLVARCWLLARRYQSRNVVVVFPNEEFLLAGYLTAIWTGARLFPYFHNLYVENHSGLQLCFARWLQARVFSKAAHVFVMSQGMAELYRERYPGVQCSPLVHSFSQPLPEFSPPPEPRSPVNLMISGNIWDVCLDATSRICDAVAQLKDSTLTFLSGTPSIFLEKMGLLRNGTCHETISSDAVTTRLGEADIVVLPHGFKGRLSPDEYRTIFPTRTIEYLICGRPILAHTPPDSYLTRFLRDHQCALVVDKPSVPALLEGFKRLLGDKGLRSELVRNALAAATSFQAQRVSESLRSRLDGN